jgi:uncharacterized membrane protein YphA (DoxX/SURF4 family)
MDEKTVQVARCLLGLSWVYHGLFPKLVTIAPIEKLMTATIGLSDNTSIVLTRAAGASEIILGILLIIFYKNRKLVMFNILALLMLCLFVAVKVPALLIEAFNPVTTNFALIGLSYVLLRAESTKRR